MSSTARQVITMTVFGNTDQATARQVITMTLEPTGNPGKRHVWDGTQWVRIPEYTWNGTSWVQVL